MPLISQLPGTFCTIRDEFVQTIANSHLSEENVGCVPVVISAADSTVGRARLAPKIKVLLTVRVELY